MVVPPNNNPYPPPLAASHAAVAADESTCSQIGVQIMQELHGNAMDAAVATCICLGVRHPFASGIGGGAVVLYVRNSNREYRFAFITIATIFSPDSIFSHTESYGSVS